MLREARNDVSPRLDDLLPSLPAEERLRILEQLVRCSSGATRERALRLGAALLEDAQIVDCLRQESDDVLRNAGIEMLKLRGADGAQLALRLLGDRDADVVLQAVLVLDALAARPALPRLRALLAHPDPNVVQAAVTAIGHIGDPAAAADVIPFLDADLWLQMAAIEALGALGSASAIAPLQSMLSDPILAAESVRAIARIGGPQAVRAISGAWTRLHEDRAALDDECWVSALADVLERLPRVPAGYGELIRPLRTMLAAAQDRSPLRIASARALLVLGDRDCAGAAVDALVGALPSETLPAALRHRRDLVDHLLRVERVPRPWAFALLTRHRGAADAASLVAAVDMVSESDVDDEVCAALARQTTPALTRPLLHLFARLGEAPRERLIAVLLGRRKQILSELDWVELDDETRLVLAARLAQRGVDYAAALVRLDSAARVRVVRQAAACRALVTRVPWKSWIRQEPETWGPLAARAAVLLSLRSLREPLRSLLDDHASIDVVRAIGALRDRTAVPRLIALMNNPSLPLQLAVVEALGRIGGAAARRQIIDCCRFGPKPTRRAAFRALGSCVRSSDLAFIRESIDADDWLVRLQCVEILAATRQVDVTADLRRLTADPMPVVAQRALFFLTAAGHLG